MHDESFHNSADDHLQEHRDILARLVALETKVENFTSTNKQMAKCLCEIEFPNKHTNVGEITVALTCPIHGKLLS
jgi:hypothetical protein